MATHSPASANRRGDVPLCERSCDAPDKRRWRIIGMSWPRSAAALQRRRFPDRWVRRMTMHRTVRIPVAAGAVMLGLALPAAVAAAGAGGAAPAAGGGAVYPSKVGPPPRCPGEDPES